MQAAGKAQARYVVRLVPLEMTCFASTEDFLEAVAPLIDHVFEDYWAWEAKRLATLTATGLVLSDQRSTTPQRKPKV